MPNFFAKLAAVGIIGGGFAVTGDLAWLASRGERLLKATTVPSEAPPAADLPAEAAAAPAPSRPAPVRAERLPTSGPDAVDLARLRAGQRVVVWLAEPPTRTDGAPPPRVTLDLIDPATGEALLTTAAGPSRRIRVHGTRGSCLVRGERPGVETAGLAHGAGTRLESLPAILALEVFD